MQELLSKIKELLIKNDLTISTGESCTGGLLSSFLTDIDGSSDYLNESFVTYSNNAKEHFLNVKKSTIDKYSVYSLETAKEMSEGLLKYSDIGISTTGIAGVNGGSKDTPVGTVYIGISNNNYTAAYKYHSNEKTRTAIKKDMAYNALLFLFKFLVEQYK